MFQSSSLLEYGQHLLDCRGIPDSSPPFTITAGDLHGIFEFLIANDSDAAWVGFLMIVPIFVSQSWRALTPVQLDCLKLDVVRACFRPMHSSFAHQYTSFVAAVLRLSDWNWPELYPQILKSRHDLDATGFLIPKVIRSMDDSLLDSLRTALIHKIFQCLPYVCYAAKLRLLRALHWLKIRDFSSEFVQTVWKFVIEMVRSHFEDSEKICQILETIYVDRSSIQQLELPPIGSDQDFKAFLPFLAFLRDDHFQVAIERIIDLVKGDFNSNLPLQMSELLKISARPKLTPQQFEIVSSILIQNHENATLRIPTIFVMLHFLPQGITETSDLASLGINWLADFPYGRSIQQKIWLFSLSILASSLHAAGLFPSNPEIAILSLLQSTDPHMYALALRVVQVLFDDMIITASQATRVYAVYNNLTPDRQSAIVAAVSLLLNHRPTDVAILQGALEFVRTVLRVATDPANSIKD